MASALFKFSTIVVIFTSALTGFGSGQRIVTVPKVYSNTLRITCDTHGLPYLPGHIKSMKIMNESQQVVASVNSNEEPILWDGMSGNMTVYGSVGSVGHLSVLIANPNEQHAGHYSCQVSYKDTYSQRAEKTVTTYAFMNGTAPRISALPKYYSTTLRITCDAGGNYMQGSINSITMNRYDKAIASVKSNEEPELLGRMTSMKVDGSIGLHGYLSVFIANANKQNDGWYNCEMEYLDKRTNRSHNQRVSTFAFTRGTGLRIRTVPEPFSVRVIEMQIHCVASGPAYSKGSIMSMKITHQYEEILAFIKRDTTAKIWVKSLKWRNLTRVEGRIINSGGTRARLDVYLQSPGTQHAGIYTCKVVFLNQTLQMVTRTVRTKATLRDPITNKPDHTTTIETMTTASTTTNETMTNVSIPTTSPTTPCTKRNTVCLDETWTYYQRDETCLKYFYKFPKREITWSEARRSCQKFGGDLVIIQDEEKNKFVYDMVYLSNYPWIGVKNYNSRRLNVRYVDGTPINTYHPWSKVLQPVALNQSCALMVAWTTDPGEWWSRPCEHRQPYVCFTSPHACRFEGWTYYKQDKTCLKQFGGEDDKDGKLGWEDARIRCMEFGDGDLVIIRDDAKNKFVLDHVTDGSGGNPWIGVINVAVEGYTFKYVDKTYFINGTFDPWDPEQLHGAELPGRKCGVMLAKDNPGKWGDRHCITDQRSYVCSMSSRDVF